MMVSDDNRSGHSADYLGPYREHWWNRDHLELLAPHWRVPAGALVLDVGAGLGHWSATLAEVLRPDVRFVGIDSEPGWVEEASRRLRQSRFSFREGNAYALPFDDSHFDVVTCQTVLIHLAEPRRALAEMFRVLRPGGLLVAAEPSGRAGFFLHDTVTAGLSLEGSFAGLGCI